MRNALAMALGVLLLGVTVAAQPRHARRNWSQAAARARSDMRAGSISGRLTDTAGQPLVNAVIHLSRVADFQRDSRNTVTDEQGRFRLTNLRRGIYNLALNVPGYVLPEEDLPRLVVRAGDTVNLTLVKGGVITGSVMSHTGEPMTGCTVQALRIADKDGQPSASSRYSGIAEVDDRGIYRLYGLAAGTYLVEAMGRHPYSNLNDIFPDDVPTYYPSAPRDTAQPITVRAGEEINSIDIRYRGERGHVVSGRVAGFATDAPSFSATLQLFSVATRAVEEGTYAGTTYARNESGFAFYGIPDGDYLIDAITVGANSKLGGGRARVKVRGADATGIELTMTPYGSINGRLVIEPLANIDPQNKCEVKRRLSPDELLVKARREKLNDILGINIGSLYQSEPSEKGEFTLAAIMPDQYHIEAAMLGEDYFVRSITLPGAAKTQPPVDAARSPLTIKSGERLDNLTVTIAEGAASMRGRVTSATENARPTARLFVHLVPAEKEAAEAALRYYEVEVNGDRFELMNLSPGRYFIIARPPTDDAGVGNAVRPVAWNASERAVLLKQASAVGTVLELKPCQRLVDYSLTTAPATKIKAAGHTP